ncbi:hypothetical protein MN116_003384 [Schistosoma mekongi]|uniref:Tubulin polymerization-promoting protein family member 3 n=1 Tax=Schistosoma mekongi TaxID=38744 RepID=A0AAE1ZHQ0_SCHME|nr:hypothetical protein MN116_003384 [Schistosoma mekongi]
MGDLERIFYSFCDAVKKGSKTGTDKMINRLCTDCNIYTKSFGNSAVDIAFRKHIGNAKKDVDFPNFVRFIEGAMAEEYAKHKKISQADAANEIKNKIINSGGPKAHGATQLSKDSATSRLTDVKGYTGSHKERFDTETGKGKGIEGREYVVDDKAASGYVGGYKGKDTYDKLH